MNPLLQNYWMTIHPPTLFLGFASTVVPFCFAIAGLWTNQHKEWLKPVMPWASFSAAILGIGILMGSAWAYEALSFGGYWAWDPVENTSLVPWLIMIAGIHTNLIARNTNYSVKSTYIFYLLSFIMIVYSTFLTRSGILGDTSVHAFTEMGLENQLVLFILTFTFISLFLYFKRQKHIPAPQKEEASSSKEFWMFIGALVLLFSAILITVSTSLPVYNKIAEVFNPTHEAITIKDQEPHHNKYQLWIAVLISLLSGFAQFFRFKEFNWKAASFEIFKTCCYFNCNCRRAYFSFELLDQSNCLAIFTFTAFCRNVYRCCKYRLYHFFFKGQFQISQFCNRSYWFWIDGDWDHSLWFEQKAYFNKSFCSKRFVE